MKDFPGQTLKSDFIHFDPDHISEGFISIQSRTNIINLADKEDDSVLGQQDNQRSPNKDINQRKGKVQINENVKSQPINKVKTKDLKEFTELDAMLQKGLLFFLSLK